MANSFASTSDLNVRVDRTALVALSLVFTALSGPKATYQISGCVMRPERGCLPKVSARKKAAPRDGLFASRRLLDDLDDAVGARLDQHGSAVHDGVAIIAHAVFRRHLVIGHSGLGQHGADPDLVAISVGRPTLL